MGLPYWVEYLLTVKRENSNLPGGLVKHVGAEYNFPLIPPGRSGFFHTDTRTAVPPRYGTIFFRMSFSNVVPNTIELTLDVHGTTAYKGLLTENSINDGINYFIAQTPDTPLTTYITNISPVYQSLYMNSQYLRISTPTDYEEVLKHLEDMKVAR